jgi:dTDP-4-dehydrorhamnose reductase
MPILVTGGGGQLASALAAAGGDSVRVVGRPEFDFDRPEAIAPLLDAAAPVAVVNAAAYTAVDRAESDAEAAMRANASGPALLATWCARAGVPLVHVSTDYVFDGLKGAPYVETDPTNPTGVYGRSKLDGETEVLASGARAIVLRTSWVYAARGQNFVLTMLKAARARPSLRVVGDQIGCPTAAPDLARAILAVLARANEAGWGGLYHAAGSGETSWHGLAVATLARAGLTTPVERIATADWPTPARRPPDSRLDCGKLAADFGVVLPEWRTSLNAVVDDAIAA